MSFFFFIIINGTSNNAINGTSNNEWGRTFVGRLKFHPNKKEKIELLIPIAIKSNFSL